MTNNWFHVFFESDPNLGIGPECARAVMLFLFGYLLMRLAGRRISGRWAALDIIVSVIVGSSLSRAITGNAPVLGTMAAMAVIVALHAFFAQLSARSQIMARALEGKAIVLGRRGRLYEGRMKVNSISHIDIEEAMRRSKVTSRNEMDRVILEPSGEIHITPVKS